MMNPCEKQPENSIAEPAANGCHDCPHPDYCAGMGECPLAAVNVSWHVKFRCWFFGHDWARQSLAGAKYDCRRCGHA